MQERSLRRAAAVGGIVFVILVVVSVVLVIPAPTPDKSAVKILKWFSDNRTAVLASAALTGVSLAAFLVFLGSVHSALRGVSATLASIAFGSGVATITM